MFVGKKIDLLLLRRSKGKTKGETEDNYSKNGPIPNDQSSSIFASLQIKVAAVFSRHSLISTTLVNPSRLDHIVF